MYIRGLEVHTYNPGNDIKYLFINQKAIGLAEDRMVEDGIDGYFI